MGSMCKNMTVKTCPFGYTFTSTSSNIANYGASKNDGACIKNALPPALVVVPSGSEYEDPNRKGNQTSVFGNCTMWGPLCWWIWMSFVLLLLCFSLFLLAFVNNKHRPLNAKKSMPFARPKSDAPAIAIEMTNNPDFGHHPAHTPRTRMSMMSQMGNDDYKKLLKLREKKESLGLDTISDLDGNTHVAATPRTRMSIMSQMGNDDYKNLLQLRSSEKEMEGDVTTDAPGTVQRGDSGVNSFNLKHGAIDKTTNIKNKKGNQKKRNSQLDVPTVAMSDSSILEQNV